MGLIKKCSYFLDPSVSMDIPTQEKFSQWYLDAKVLQIRYVAYLTGFLYLLYLGAEFLIFGDKLQLWRIVLHGGVIPLLLLYVALMSYRAILHKKMRYTLMGASIFAMSVNLSLNSWSGNYAYYAPELYLNLIWVFVISGLVLTEATITALISLFIIFLFALVAPATSEFLVLHTLWLLAAFSFGFLSAFLVERMYKSLFLQQEQLHYLAEIDGLTTLYNRHKIEKTLHEEIQKVNENQEPLSIVLLDIDLFKAINDTFGHVLGDTILQEFAQILKENMPKGAYVGRFGGEEFLIVLPKSSKEEAMVVAEEIREKIKAYSFTTIGEKTASFGVASYERGESFVALFTRADRALYEAKASGRDCVRVF